MFPDIFANQELPWDVHLNMIPEKGSPFLRMELRLVKVGLFRPQPSTQNKANRRQRAESIRMKG
uniref:Uncharacterized protein n=1 Tax=Bionectria ochroleuca TaxID=29856 RepID=A0A0B7KGJ7_BIOOC